MESAEITEHTVKTGKAGKHITSYLATGPEDGPLIIFVHGWPELAISWRHQLPVMAALGFRAIAPDMRGYGSSSVYGQHSDYAQEHIVGDMIGLLDHLGPDKQRKAVWVGHDWGSPVVWNIASHHPDRCHAVASLCVPYNVLEHGLDGLLPLIDRNIYPEDKYPVGQWDYMLHYEENFDAATAQMDANPFNMVKALFRKGKSDSEYALAVTTTVRRDGGWFGGLPEAPDVPRDTDVLGVRDLSVYAAGLQRNGFFGPNSYYMNHTANAAYAAKAEQEGYLDMPVLFIAGRYDVVCESVNSRLAEPQQKYCRDLTTGIIDSGHWMAQEKPVEVNGMLVQWLATSVRDIWPV